MSRVLLRVLFASSCPMLRRVCNSCVSVSLCVVCVYACVRACGVCGNVCACVRVRVCVCVCVWSVAARRCTGVCLYYF
jgi:hypothetical protein